MADTSSWPSYGRDYSNQRYSPLSQITSVSIKDLKPAWHYATGIRQAFEASPVVISNVMYVSTPLNHVVALDAKTGRKLWEHAESLGTTVHCCGPVNRGVAVYAGRVYMGTLDARLVALDARTGTKVWDVRVADNERGYAVDAAPVAADGKVIVGVSGAEYGIRGRVTAYDAATGAEVWRFYTIPSPEEGGWWGKWSADRSVRGPAAPRSGPGEGGQRPLRRHLESGRRLGVAGPRDRPRPRARDLRRRERLTRSRRKGSAGRQPPYQFDRRARPVER